MLHELDRIKLESEKTNAVLKSIEWEIRDWRKSMVANNVGNSYGNAGRNSTTNNNGNSNGSMGMYRRTQANDKNIRNTNIDHEDNEPI